MFHDHAPTALAGAGRETRPAAQPQAVASRYRHILVSTFLEREDRAALLQALELAALHRATLAVLYLRPDDDANSFNWLDAIDRLHRPAAEVDEGGSENGDEPADDELLRLHVRQFLERELPASLLDTADIRIDWRSGDPGDAIARFADEAAADLIVVSSGPSHWWAPSLPSAVRRVLQLSKREVLIVRSDAQSARADEGR